MTLDLYLKYKNCIITEGYTQQVSKQVEILKDLVNNNKIINILEIGFNAGHSSCLFLETNRNCKVHSFDIDLISRYEARRSHATLDQIG